ncbi:ANTAR domain-containing protein [Cryptosporangium phraense]|nr:ANTAR domain-containing protein [Cryptosporangium phraense]
MNLYSRDRAELVDLAEEVRAAFRASGSAPASTSLCGPATSVADLATGVAEALAVRDQIQQAIGMIVGRERCSTEEAYLALRIRAAEVGLLLPEVATEILRRTR